MYIFLLPGLGTWALFPLIAPLISYKLSLILAPPQQTAAITGGIDRQGKPYTAPAESLCNTQTKAVL